MSKTNIEPEVPFIKKNDTVSGTYFREFLSKYRAYDKKQKEIIENQRKQIRMMTSELAWYKEEIPEEKDEKAQKIRNMGKLLAQLNNKIITLKQEIADLEKKLNNE